MNMAVWRAFICFDTGALGASGLHGEIGLCKRNFVLFGIAVLRDQIAGVASEHDVINFALAT